jgi:hypothetical protein
VLSLKYDLNSQCYLDEFCLQGVPESLKLNLVVFAYFEQRFDQYFAVGMINLELCLPEERYSESFHE